MQGALDEAAAEHEVLVVVEHQGLAGSDRALGQVELDPGAARGLGQDQATDGAMVLPDLGAGAEGGR